MDEIWQQFHRLPRSLRDAVARPEALRLIDALETKYPKLDLAGFIMEVMVKEMPISDMPMRIRQAAGVSDLDAQDIQKQLITVVFQPVATYLQIPEELIKPNIAESTEIPAETPTFIAASRPPEPPSTLPIPSPDISSLQARSPIGPHAPTTQYSLDDEAEIQHHASTIRQMSNAGLPDLDSVAQEVLDMHQLAFGDELLTKRARSIIKAQLKQIRDEDDTRQMLSRDPKVGGLGLDPDIAGLVAGSAASRMKTLSTRGAVAAPMPIPPAVPPPVPKMVEQKPAAMPPFKRAGAMTAMLDKDLPSMTEVPRASRPIMRPADIPLPPVMAPAQIPKPKEKPQYYSRTRSLAAVALKLTDRFTGCILASDIIRMMAKRPKQRQEKGVFDSIRKPTAAPPSQKIGKEKRSEKLDPVQRKAKHKGPSQEAIDV